METLYDSCGFIELAGNWYTNPMQQSTHWKSNIFVYVAVGSIYTAIPIPVSHSVDSRVKVMQFGGQNDYTECYTNLPEVPELKILKQPTDETLQINS